MTALTTTHSDGLLALWISADGAIASVLLPLDPDERTRTLARLVDGNLDAVRLDERTDMWVNGEFLFRWDEPNVMATRVAGVHGFDTQTYHGPVVLTGGASRHGDTLGLDDTSASMLAAIAFYSTAEGPIRADEVDGHRFWEFTERRDRYGA